jgi:hypothetical protein
MRAETGDALEMAAVPGHENEIVYERRRGNEESEIWDDTTLPAQGEAFPGKALHCAIREVENGIAIKELPEATQVPVGVRE